MEIDQATTVSRLRDRIQSAEASASDFDPFVDWDLSSIQCCCYWIPQNWKLEIHINCTQKCQKVFYLIIGEKEIHPNVLWSGSISGGFRVMLTIYCGLITRSPSSQAVSVGYHSDQLPKKELPLGTLNYDIITKAWIFVPRPRRVFPKSPQPTPANAEAIGDEMTSIEESPSALPGNNHQAE
jgi:hypothetical protein